MEQNGIDAVRLLLPLRSAPLALLWGGLSLSALGDQLYAVALSWIAVGVFGAGAGYLAALNAAAVVLAAFGIGRWADRWDVRRSMVAADLARAAVLLAVVAAWLAQGGPSGTALVVAVLVLAVGQAVFQPALQAALPALTPDAALLPAANGLLDATDRSARLLGPGLVALMAGAIPLVHFLSLDALSFVASAAALLLIGRLRPGRPAAPAAARPQASWSGILRGARAMAGHPLLGYVLRGTAFINGAWYAAFYLGLPLMIERFGVAGPTGGGLGAFGAVISAYGCTNLAATLVFGGRRIPERPQFQMFSGSLVVGLGIVLMGAAVALPPPARLAGLMAAAAFGAVGGPMKDIPVAVLRQTRLARGDMAAAMRAYMAASSFGVLVAMLALPTVIDRVGVVAVVVGCGVLVAGVALLGLVRHAGFREGLRPG